MTHTTIALTQLASYLFAVLCWLTYDMVNFVAEGYEDEYGFHFGRPGDAQR